MSIYRRYFIGFLTLFFCFLNYEFISREFQNKIYPHDIDSIASVSFTPDYGYHLSNETNYSVESIREDLNAVSHISHHVRTYTVSNNLDLIPQLAEERSMSVSLGAWIGQNQEDNIREIQIASRLSNLYQSVTDVIVGNETLLRKDASEDDLIGYIRDVKALSHKPVTTAETWDIWLKHPKLANEVDFITVHILPFWEGTDIKDVLRNTFEHYTALQNAYPTKKIVIGEFGWPSGTLNHLEAVPSIENQAELIRDFVNEANLRGIQYNIIEAFDQPWKTQEGNVGAYWGIFDTNHNLKFPLTGPVYRYSHEYIIVF